MGRMDTGWSQVDWFPMDILGAMAGGTASVFTLGGRSGVCTGDGGGTGGGILWGDHPWSRWVVLSWGRLGLL